VFFFFFWAQPLTLTQKAHLKKKKYDINHHKKTFSFLVKKKHIFFDVFEKIHIKEYNVRMHPFEKIHIKEYNVRMHPFVKVMYSKKIHIKEYNVRMHPFVTKLFLRVKTVTYRYFEFFSNIFLHIAL